MQLAELKQAYGMSYKLISRVIAASVQPDVFAVPSQPGEIVVKGEGTAVPAHDVVVLASVIEKEAAE